LISAKAALRECSGPFRRYSELRWGQNFRFLPSKPGISGIMEQAPSRRICNTRYTGHTVAPEGRRYRRGPRAMGVSRRYGKHFFKSIFRIRDAR
jgi:hypothetical protein